MIVVDATIAAKWYLTEDGTEAAIALLSENQDAVAAPDLIQIEVAGAITRRHRMSGLAGPDAKTLIADWTRDIERGRVELERWQTLLDEATALSLAIGHALVDCFYLILAMRLHAPLFTADQKLHRRGLLAYEHIRLL